MILELKNLTKYFGGLCAVNNVSFSLDKGQVKSIIGPNGAGKTTLFNLISGTLNADAGDTFFRGQRVTKLPPHKLCRLGMARSFQITNIFQGLTVFENARLAAQGQVRKLLLLGSVNKLPQQRDDAKKVLELVGLWHQRDELAGNLSHGDQRHLEIAITLASKPSLLLLDEPTAGMTRAEARGTIDLVKRLRGTVTILLIEHDMDLVFELSEKIVVLHLGEVLAEGDGNEIKRNKEVQKAYLGEDI